VYLPLALKLLEESSIKLDGFKEAGKVAEKGRTG